MSFVIIEPALAAALLVASPIVGPSQPASRSPAAASCGGHQTGPAGFDCCLDLAKMGSSLPPTAITSINPAPSSEDTAVGQKKGR